MLSRSFLQLFALLALIGVPKSTDGWVLCFETDGRLSLERGLLGSCGSEIAEAEPSELRLEEDHCGPCQDETLGMAAFDRSRLQDGKTPTVLSVSPIPQLLSHLRLVDTALPALPEEPGELFFTALRSVILRI